MVALARCKETMHALGLKCRCALRKEASANAEASLFQVEGVLLRVDDGRSRLDAIRIVWRRRTG
jgi:hypothetical protein